MEGFGAAASQAFAEGGAPAGAAPTGTPQAPAAPQASPAPAGGPAPVAASPEDKLRAIFGTQAPQNAPTESTPQAQTPAQQAPEATPQGQAEQAPAQVEGLADLQARLAETRNHASQVAQENARLREELGKGQQAALEKMTQAIEKITEIQQSKTLTPEEKQAQIDAEFAEINSGKQSPKEVVRKWVGQDIEGLKKTVQELEAKLAQTSQASERADRYAVRNENIARLHSIGFQEVADAKFSGVMFSPDNVAEVLTKFYPTDPALTPAQKAERANTIYKDQAFYERLYHSAKAKAAAGFQQTVNQSQADRAAVGQLAAAAPQPSGHAPGAAPAPQLTPDQQLKQQIMGTRKSFGQALADVQFKQF